MPDIVLDEDVQTFVLVHFFGTVSIAAGVIRFVAAVANVATA